MLRNLAINFVLKMGLAVTCVGYAICALVYPNSVIEFYPQFVPNIIGDLATLIIGAAVSLFMAAWIISRRHKFACSFTFLILISLAILTNLTSLRFVSVAWPLFVISLALAVRYYPRVRVIVSHKDGERMRIVPIADEATDEHAAPAVAAATPDQSPIETNTPARLEDDPAQTSEFLSNEKFVRGNKFSEGQTEVGYEPAYETTHVSAPVTDSISEATPVREKQKRTYKPRSAGTKKAHSSRKLASAVDPVTAEIHEEF